MPTEHRLSDDFKTALTSSLHMTADYLAALRDNINAPFLAIHGTWAKHIELMSRAINRCDDVRQAMESGAFGTLTIGKIVAQLDRQQMILKNKTLDLDYYCQFEENLNDRAEYFQKIIEPAIIFAPTFHYDAINMETAFKTLKRDLRTWRISLMILDDLRGDLYDWLDTVQNDYIDGHSGRYESRLTDRAIASFMEINKSKITAARMAANQAQIDGKQVLHSIKSVTAGLDSMVRAGRDCAQYLTHQPSGQGRPAPA